MSNPSLSALSYDDLQFCSSAVRKRMLVVEGAQLALLEQDLAAINYELSRRDKTCQASTLKHPKEVT
jgi:hypothetical protein